MDKAKGVFKSGWHPEPREGSRRDQVAGLVGRGKSKQDVGAVDRAKNHQSTPLQSLKDPSSFGPPPKHQHYHGAEASQERALSIKSGSAASASRYNTHNQADPSRQQEEEKPKAPPTPYRRDTTGLNTANLPKPPRIGELPSAASPRAPATLPSSAERPKPPLPARPPLPPRQNSNPDEFTPAPPPPYAEAGVSVNHGALNRLGNAGVNVPGFNIGRNAASPPPVQSSTTNELQSRFSRMSTSSGTAAGSAQGTSFAQKQQAFKTASAFRNDPSSVSLSDARSAASTANNFRERHGEQVASGFKTANGLNQKYGVMNRVNGIASGNAAGSVVAGGAPSATGPSNAAAAAASKKPPPPPPKKKELQGDSAAPPPIPLGSKPKS